MSFNEKKWKRRNLCYRIFQQVFHPISSGGVSFEVLSPEANRRTLIWNKIEDILAENGRIDLDELLEELLREGLIKSKDPASSEVKWIEMYLDGLKRQGFLKSFGGGIYSFPELPALNCK